MLYHVVEDWETALETEYCGCRRIDKRQEFAYTNTKRLPAPWWYRAPDILKGMWKMELKDFTEKEQQQIREGLSTAVISDKAAADKILALVP
jgi:hypothetical protein